MQHSGWISKKHSKQMKLKGVVHTIIYHVVLEYSKVIYNGWNLLNDYWRFGGREWL